MEKDDITKIVEEFEEMYPNMSEILKSKNTISSDDRVAWKDAVPFHNWLRTTLESYGKHCESKGREEVIERVESVIAEFGDQGIECVAGILDESFHGQKEVQY